MADNDELNMSKLSLNSNDSQSEDWDRSLMLMDDSEPSSPTEAQQSRSRTIAATTPRNSVIFPGDRDSTPRSGPKPGAGDGKRSLSELLRLHSEKGTDVKFSTEEASRVAEVLGQWVGGSSFLVATFLLVLIRSYWLFYLIRNESGTHEICF